jgi:hypothetical protein
MAFQLLPAYFNWHLYAGALRRAAAPERPLYFRRGLFPPPLYARAAFAPATGRTFRAFFSTLTAAVTAGANWLACVRENCRTTTLVESHAPEAVSCFIL